MGAGSGGRPALSLRGPLAQWDLDAEKIRAFAAGCGVSVQVARLLIGRGVEDEDAARAWLQPRLRDLRNPKNMAGFDVAITHLVDAARRGLRLGIFGDYDVDGITTATILSTYLGALGVDIVAKVASRGGGYGFTAAAATAFVEAGVDLVILGDCGTSDLEPIAWLAERNVPVIVVDHHQVPDTKPAAVALINPHQEGCEFPFKGLCSAGVAFFLCAALRTALSEGGWTAPLPDPRGLLDLVALGTVCDMVPLVAENRILVRHGLVELSRRRRPGLRALLDRAGIDGGVDIDEGHLGFQLGPRLNAPGRLGAAEPAFHLLRARSSAEAIPVAAQVEACNRQRGAHQARIVDEAFAQLEADPRTPERGGIVVAGEGWPAGVVGIAANGIVERYGRPALVLAFDAAAGEVRGSARSHGGVDVHRALADCADLLIRFGGHPAAAGVSLRTENVEALIEAFDQAVSRQRAELPESAAAIPYDGVLGLEEICPALIDDIKGLAPYGQAFPAPLYLLADAHVVRARIIKERHLLLTLDLGLEHSPHRREAMAFGKGDLPVKPGDRVGMTFRPIRDEYRGRVRVQLRPQEIWILGAS